MVAVTVSVSTVEIFNDLLSISQSVQALKHLEGRFPGLQLGICTDRDDPMGLARIRATVSNMGGKSQTDWLMRECPFGGLSMPVPALNDTVCVIYKDGDPHQGFYLGVVQNAINPAGDKDSLILQIPKAIVLQVGSVSISVVDGKVAITGASDITFNGKAAASVGAKDSRNDLLVTRGW